MAGFHSAFFLCLTAGLMISDSRSRSTGCPSGWSVCGARCFIVITTRKTMADAERHCLSMGGNLASIHTSEEHSFIRNLIFKRCYSYGTAWIGLFDAIQEGQWFWTDGTKVSTTFWAGGEPNNVGGEHCTETNFRTFYWNDIPCRFHKPFVCARKM